MFRVSPSKPSFLRAMKFNIRICHVPLTQCLYSRSVRLSQGKRWSFLHTALTWWFSDVVKNEKCFTWRSPPWHKPQTLRFFTSSLLPLCLFDSIINPLLLLLLLLLVTIYIFIITVVLMLTRITSFEVVNRLLLFLLPVRTDNVIKEALQS